MKRIVFGGFCMVSGVLLFSLMFFMVFITVTNLSFMNGWWALLALSGQIAGVVLTVYGFSIARRELWADD